MHIDELGRLMRDGRRISGVHVSLDDGELARLHDSVKKTPAIASIALQRLSLGRFPETIERNITTMTAVYVVLAFIIAFGVIYNSARIQLSERARELASLRVFGSSGRRKLRIQRSPCPMPTRSPHTSSNLEN